MNVNDHHSAEAGDPPTRRGVMAILKRKVHPVRGPIVAYILLMWISGLSAGVDAGDWTVLGGMFWISVWGACLYVWSDWAWVAALMCCCIAQTHVDLTIPQTFLASSPLLRFSYLLTLYGTYAFYAYMLGFYAWRGVRYLVKKSTKESASG